MPHPPGSPFSLSPGQSHHLDPRAALAPPSHDANPTRLQAPTVPQAPAYFQTPAEAMAAAMAAANAAAADARAAQFGLAAPAHLAQAPVEVVPPSLAPSPAPARAPLSPVEAHWVPGFPVAKDGALDNLARLLNSTPAEALPTGDVVETREQYGTLMAYLEPWVVASPAEPLAVPRRPSPLVLDCKSPR